MCIRDSRCGDACRKMANYALRKPRGYHFTPLCSTTDTLLSLLECLGAASGRVIKGGWVQGSLRRLSVASARGTTFVPGVLTSTPPHRCVIPALHSHALLSVPYLHVTCMQISSERHQVRAASDFNLWGTAAVDLAHTNVEDERESPLQHNTHVLQPHRCCWLPTSRTEVQQKGMGAQGIGARDVKIEKLLVARLLSTLFAHRCALCRCRYTL